MKTKISSVALLLLLSVPVLAGEIRDLFEKQQAGKLGPQMFEGFGPRAETPDHGISQIGIEHTPCFGSCPVFTVVVNRDGSFRYVGRQEGRSRLPEFGGKVREGNLTGRIEAWEFENLARFMKEAGFMSLTDRYEANVTDSATVYTMVVMNSARKIVSNYANTGPAKLWAMERLIDRLLESATWDEPAATTNPKK